MLLEIPCEHLAEVNSMGEYTNAILFWGFMLLVGAGCFYLYLWWKKKREQRMRQDVHNILASYFPLSDKDLDMEEGGLYVPLSSRRNATETSIDFEDRSGGTSF